MFTAATSSARRRAARILRCTESEYPNFYIRIPQIGRVHSSSHLQPPTSTATRRSLPVISFQKHASSSPSPFTSTFESAPLSDAQRRTIYALSTPPGKAGIAVIRISGPDALECWYHVVRVALQRSKDSGETGSFAWTPEPWKMYRCELVHPDSREVLDDGLAVFFRGPRSFTTEDTVELHIHSGRAVTSAVLSALSSLPYCRPAERGEFTRRAFDGGRLELTQVEGLRDLIDAETEVQRKVAMSVARGLAKDRYDNLRSEAIQCLALVEALIDFGEGEDIEEGVFDQAFTRVENLRNTINGHLLDAVRGERLREGIRVAIFGPPNAGKSSLLNFLGRDAAIVTPVPGTTRDILEVSLDLGGLPVIIADTAGLRETEDVVEKIGIERAETTVQKADLSLCVLSLPDLLVQSASLGGEIAVPNELSSLVKASTLLLLNKSDLASARLPPLPTNAWVASLYTHEGMNIFVEALTKALFHWYTQSHSQVDNHSTPLITHARHRAHLASALSFLDAFLEVAPLDLVLGAEELRYAARAIGKVGGVIDVEDVLDVVFEGFCIGK